MIGFSWFRQFFLPTSLPRCQRVADTEMPPKKKPTKDWAREFNQALAEKELQSSNEATNEANFQNDKDVDVKVEADMRLEEILSKASPHDVWLEYMYFKRSMPKLLEWERSELLSAVKEHLKIPEVKKKMSEDLDDESINLGGKGFPILEALSIKMGVSLLYILAPPCTTCLICNRTLTRYNTPCTVALHTLDGPVVATKFSYRCHRCKGGNGANLDLFYACDFYGNTTHGLKRYPPHLKVDVFRASTEEYFTDMFLKGYMSELQHQWSSAESKAASYNETFRGGRKVQLCEAFIQQNSHVARHFDSKKGNLDADLIDDADPGNETNTAKSQVRNTFHELGRKNLSTAFYNREVYEESVERSEVEDITYGPKCDSDNSTKKISFKRSLEEYMIQVDHHRRNSLYKHTDEDCSQACLDLGCGRVATIDGKGM